MKLTLFINLDNDAFKENTAQETKRILKDLTNRLDYYSFTSLPHKIILKDLNGNPVGTVTIEN